MNILAIGAHFDDVELGCGGTLSKHVQDGDQVYVYVATVSGYINQYQQEIRSNSIAKEEAINAMNILGIKEMICGQFETLNLEFNDALNIEILRIIEQKNIDQVYTHWVGDIHHDHQSIARATLHSARHIPRLLMYRSNWYHSTMDFRGNFYVDITQTWDKKAAAILAHKSEDARTGSKWLGFFRNEAENAGQKIGVQLAEPFEIVKYLIC